MSKFLTDLIDKDIDSRYFELHWPLRYQSDILDCIIEVPVGFIYDHESVPIIKGTSNRGGAIHDYLCRKDNPFADIVDIQKAADIYLEAMECRDKLLGDCWSRKWRRHVKSNFVRLNWCGFWHRWSVYSTYEEIKGNIA
jgi:hypothetical protein